MPENTRKTIREGVELAYEFQSIQQDLSQIIEEWPDFVSFSKNNAYSDEAIILNSAGDGALIWGCGDDLYIGVGAPDHSSHATLGYVEEIPFFAWDQSQFIFKSGTAVVEEQFATQADIASIFA